MTGSEQATIRYWLPKLHEGERMGWPAEVAQAKRYLNEVRLKIASWKAKQGPKKMVASYDEILNSAREVRAGLRDDDPESIRFDKMQAKFYEYRNARQHQPAQDELKNIAQFTAHNRHRISLEAA